MSATEPIQIHIPPDVAEFAKPCTELLKGRDAGGVAVGGFIFANSTGNDRVLLVQREKRDGKLAGKWEVPGGGCELSDPTVLHSVAREVYEEVGLHMTGVRRRIGKDLYFKTRSGLNVVKFSFEITVKEVDGAVEVDKVPVELSHEHQDFTWATLAEIEADKYAITHVNQRDFILQAFALRKEAGIK